MSIEVFKRTECKFLIQEDICEEFKTKLLQYMEMDEHNKNNNFYTISNIYYDTKDNYLIRNSLLKPKYKEKLRIRSYGVPNIDDKIYLEIKKKVNGIGNKRRTSLKLREAYEFISTGEKPGLKSYMNKQVINEIEYMLRLYNLEPKVYIAYDRKAMFGKDNREVRITFDRDIRTRRHDLKLEAGDYGEPLLESGKCLVEIKVEKNFPLWLSQLLSQYKIYKASFSKYGNEYKKMIINNKNLKGEMNKCSTQYLTQYPTRQLSPKFL